MRGNRPRNLLALSDDGEFFWIVDGRDTSEASLGFVVIQVDEDSGRR